MLITLFKFVENIVVIIATAPVVTSVIVARSSRCVVGRG
jgi:hypothetical protein